MRLLKYDLDYHQVVARYNISPQMVIAPDLIYITLWFISQNIFRSLHTSSSVVHIKSTVNIQIIRGLFQCYCIVKNTVKNFYLTIFMAINTNIMNKTFKTFKTYYIKGTL